jgi:hypothetical protein
VREFGRSAPPGGGREEAGGWRKASPAQISQFLKSPPARQRQCAREITELAEDPVLRPFAAIDSDARTAIDDAMMLLEAAGIQ